VRTAASDLSAARAEAPFFAAVRGVSAHARLLRDQPRFRSAAAAAHFANPRNDFWRLLADADLTPRLLVPEEQWEMLDLGFGLTNAAYRTTKGAATCAAATSPAPAERFERLAEELEAAEIAFVGKSAYEGVLRERPEHGLQERRLGEDAAASSSIDARRPTRPCPT
jgi:hypothetical protein